MTKLSELRMKYPQYKDMSDQQFADSFHDKYYKDVPKAEYYLKVGYSPKASAPQVKPSEQRAMKAAQDRAAAGHDDNAFLQSLGSIANGASFGLLNTIDAGRVKAQTQVENLIRDATGKPQRFSSDEAYRATKKVNDQASAKFAASHPMTNFTGNLMGGIIAPGVSPAASWAGKGTGLFSQVGRGALVGGATGAAYGAGGAEDGQRIKGAEVGGLTGAAIGGALPVAAEVTKAVAKPLVRTANKIINSRTGGKVNILNPKREAMKSVAAALKRDGATAEQAKQITNEWMKSGASSPSLMDMASKLPSGGQATIGLVRGAALPSGPARGAAINYANQVGADLQDNAIGHTMRLTPNEQRPAQAVLAGLEQNQAVQSAAEYGAPYAQQVAAAPVIPALQGGAGVQGMRAAAREADAMSMRPEVAGRIPQLQQLAQGLPDDLQNVDIGTLDRIKIALNNMGDEAAANGRGGEASGFHQRAALIDRHLADNSPAYAAARDNFSQRAQGIDSLSAGARGYGATPEQLAINTPDKAAGGIGYRQALVDQIGNPTEGALGTLNKIATSTNQTQKLDDLYGQAAREQYQGAIGNERLRAQNANSINPMNGSRTAVNMADTVDANMVSAGASAMQGNFGALLSKLISNPTLTDQEREQIVRLVLGQAQIPQVANANGSVISPYATGLAVQQQNNGNR